ncbi:MAG: SPOR domain-containing protein [Pseudomonadota bacterium]
MGDRLQGSDQRERASPVVAFAQTGVAWTSAIVSLSLIAGLIYWGVHLTVRDAEAVPVIRAMTTPARTAPDLPGGEAAAHQGLEVNEILAGRAASEPEESRLAPPPSELDAALAPAPLDLDAVPVPSGAGVAAAPPEPPPDAAAPAEAVTIDDLVEQVLSGEPAADDVRPRPRPAALEEPPASRAGYLPVVEVMPSGTPAIQLGAFQSLGSAQAAWSRVSQLNDDLLADRLGFVEEALWYGETRYRLRAAGFQTFGEASGLCTALRPRGVSCVPVTVR